MTDTGPDPDSTDPLADPADEGDAGGYVPPVLPERTDEGTGGPLPDLPEQAYPPGAVPVEAVPARDPFEEAVVDEEVEDQGDDDAGGDE